MSDSSMQCLMHGVDWAGQDVSGYYGSEKLNGCRAFWDGYHLLSRSGRLISAPERIIKPLPAGVPIDGELYAEIGGFELTRIATQYGRFDPRVRFVAFDAPETVGDWFKRISYVWEQNIECVDVIQIESMQALISIVQKIERKGGEGIMLHKPGEGYYLDRVDSLLKMKPYMLQEIAIEGPRQALTTQKTGNPGTMGLDF